jgi:4'-phosphopantetheinyl transferase EntD
MIERLLPAMVSCGSARGDAASAELLPEEAALVAGATDARQREFATARGCAHAALGRLGVAAAPILRGVKHQPIWPPGIVGSITPCRGSPAGVGYRILRGEEREWLARAPASGHWDRVIFSAKESVYKAWFPLTGRWLGFGDAIVVIDPAAGSFHARLLVDGPAPLREFAGRFLVEDGLVVTAIALPA